MNIFQRLKPLFVIVAMITVTAYATGADSGRFAMHFMAGFFLVFSGFKMLDLPGFVKGYQKYDLLAKHVPAYGYVYAFAELGLGLAYARGITDPLLHQITLGLMLFSGLGVVVATVKKLDVRCACLGTLINVPLTYVTVVEDFGMAAMALWMLFG